MGMLPAVLDHDFSSFGEALYAYNYLVGEAFADVQEGELLQFVRSGSRIIHPSATYSRSCSKLLGADGFRRD